jgi:hypothetical protein
MKLGICLDIWWDSLEGGSARYKAATYAIQHDTENEDKYPRI